MSQLMMYWLPGTPVKTYELPPEYTITNYKTEADKKAWVDCCQDGLLDEEDGPDCFDAIITNVQGIDIYKDVFFIDHAGEHVATVTAFAYKDPKQGGVLGDMHMVSVRPDYRGKGLAKYLTQITLLHLKDVPDLKYIGLTTDDWRRAAVKGYLDGGFKPVDREPTARARWQAILNDPAFKREELQLINLDLTDSCLLKRSSVRGKIIAMGGGFGGEAGWELAEEIYSLSGKRVPNYLYIPTPELDGGAGGMSMWAKMGVHCDVLYLTYPGVTEELIAEKIRAADIIHVPGGNLRFCMDYWTRTNTVKYLREAFDAGKVLFGASTGSMCWFRKGFDDCGRRDEFRFVQGCDLIPYCNVPHYENANWNSFKRYASVAGMSTVACENDTALCYLDGRYDILVSKNRPDARVWFFDATKNYERFDLTAHPEILEKM